MSEDLSLYHVGVKGMRWGHRKPEAPQNSGYSDAQRATDKGEYGKRGVARINQRMNSGKTYVQAQRAESRRKIAKTLAIGASALLIDAAIGYVANNQGAINKGLQQRYDARGAANRFADARGLGMGPKLAKKKNGAYKLTTL